MKFRKKPVVIEAWQIPEYGQARESAPPWLMEAIFADRVKMEPGKGGCWIVTLEGDMRGDVGDWIIQGVKGELYPCKPDIFEATYERVSESEI